MSRSTTPSCFKQDQRNHETFHSFDRPCRVPSIILCCVRPSDPRSQPSNVDRQCHTPCLVSSPDIQLEKITTPMCFRSPVKDPYDLHYPGTLETVEFYDHRTFIHNNIIVRVLSFANSAAMSHPGDDLIGTQEHLQYWVDEVQLLLIPSEPLTWRMWHNAIVTMVGFVVDRRMTYEWSFIVLGTGESVPYRSS